MASSDITCSGKSSKLYMTSPCEWVGMEIPKRLVHVGAISTRRPRIHWMAPAGILRCYDPCSCSHQQCITDFSNNLNREFPVTYERMKQNTALELRSTSSRMLCSLSSIFARSHGVMRVVSGAGSRTRRVFLRNEADEDKLG